MVSDKAKAKPTYEDITFQNNLARSISKEITISNNIKLLKSVLLYLVL